MLGLPRLPRGVPPQSIHESGVGIAMAMSLRLALLRAQFPLRGKYIGCPEFMSSRVCIELDVLPCTTLVSSLAPVELDLARRAIVFDRLVQHPFQPCNVMWTN